MSILKLKGNASGTGTVTLEAPNTNTDQTIAIPDGAGSFVTANASGDVGIGTSSPTTKGHFYSSTSMDQLSVDGAGAIETGINFKSGGTTYGQIYFNNVSPYDMSVLQQYSTGSLIFGTNDTERARIDSSGNLLVHKTSPDQAVEGMEFAASNYLLCTKSGGTTAYFNRTTSDGVIAEFRKDGSSVGSIASGSGRLAIGDRSASLRFVDASQKRISPFNITSLSDYDALIDLGESGSRFQDIFATNGTIQTSDANEKQQIALLTDDEITAAKAISKLFKTFKWNSAVEAKGDAARTHTGVIAQEVQQAMTDAGLDAGNYAFFIRGVWWETQTEVPAVEADEENGIEAKEAYTRTETYDTLEEAPEGATERTRLGIRYPELLAFIGAATEQRLASIEARLDALEAV